MQQFLQSASRIAVVNSPALGDSVLMMIVVRNLHESGKAVTVFGQQISELAAWFPDVDIRPVQSSTHYLPKTRTKSRTTLHTS